MFSRAVYGSAPGGAHGRSTRRALDRDHARRSGGVPSRALHSRSRGARRSPATCRCCRHERSLEGKLGGLEESGDVRRRTAVTEPAPICRTEDLLHRAAQLRADESRSSARRRSSARIPTTTRSSVMNKIIGGGPTGRLFIHLREEKGYTYGASERADCAAATAATGRRRPTCAPR